MPRSITIADAKRRDAQVEIVSPAKGEPVQWIERDSRAPLHVERLVKQTERTTYAALLAARGSDPAAVGEALVGGDPELDLEQVGRRLGRATRVWVGPEGQILHAARVLEVIVGPDGVERSRRDFVDVEATVGEEMPAVPWTGRLMGKDEVVRRFALGRKLQLRHVNGLTFDFLFEMAARLHQEDKLLVVGSGPRGQGPLVFQTNGTPFRGFLEGRVEGEAYRLVLHLSNLELRRAARPTDASGG